MPTKSPVLIGGRSFSLSSLEKVLWPEDGFTKSDLIKYYVQIAPYMLAHLQDRPMVFTRYPNGIENKSFYQKNSPEYLPEWIDTLPVYSSDSKRNINYILVNEQATLAWLANQACIEMHPWLSRINNLDHPDFAVFDLDPSSGSTFDNVIIIAQILHQLLDTLGLRSYIKTSGSLGLHIYVPLINHYTYEEVRIFAQKVADLTARSTRAISTIERSVRLRGDKIYIDYLQNGRGKTLCSVYSVRPQPGATVSAPLNWEELPAITPKDFTINSIIPRLREQGDLFAPVLTDKQSLENASNKLASPVSV